MELTFLDETRLGFFTLASGVSCLMGCLVELLLEGGLLLAALGWCLFG